jgi:hypothetical protein
LTSDTSASTTFAVGPAGAPPLIYASAATVAATSETATARPTVLGNFMGAPIAHLTDLKVFPATDYFRNPPFN